MTNISDGAKAENERLKAQALAEKREAKRQAEIRRSDKKSAKRKCVMCGTEESERTPFFAHPDGIGPSCKEPQFCEHYRLSGKAPLR